MKKEKPKKYKMDVSAGFYPFISGIRKQSLFCVSATLDFDVDGGLLSVAVNDVIGRFPLYKTQVKKGYALYFLKENFSPVPVFEWSGKPLTPIDLKLSNGYHFRLSYGKRRVYLDMFHGITDGNGGMRFLLAVVRRLRELSGCVFGEDCLVPKVGESVPNAEYEDSFVESYKSHTHSKVDVRALIGDSPHRIGGTLLCDGFKVDEWVASSSSLLEKARGCGVTITAFLAGALAYSIALQGKIKHPITIMVPVNLRKMFTSVTARNFVLFVRLTLRGEDCVSFSDCVKICSEQLAKKATTDEMKNFIASTVKSQRNPLFRMIPLFVKWTAIRLFRGLFKARQTIVLSNLGNASLCEELKVKRTALFLNVSRNNVLNMAVSSNGEACTIALTRAIKETAVFDTLVRLLEENGVKMTKADVYDAENAHKASIMQ